MLAGAVLAATLVLLGASTTSADANAQSQKGKKAPEVPLAAA
jgi:hypothetical protein